MVYVGGPYQIDVFFSYAHGGDTRLREWSLKIPEKLRQEICTSLRLKSEVTIFEDPDLDRAGKFAEQLEANARGAAVLFIVFSDYYASSEWCAKERRWFFEAVQRDGRDEGVVFVASAFPIDRTSLPPELQGRLGYAFHDEGEAKRKSREEVRPFGWIQSTYGKLEEAIVEVAGKIAICLKRIKDRNEALRAAHGGFGTTNNGAVYLHVSPEDRGAWSGPFTQLSKRFAVVPTTAPVATSDPATREEVRRRRVELCAECDALLLLRSVPDDLIELDLMRIGRRFRGEVQEKRRAWIPCAVLDLIGEPLPLADQLNVTRLPTTLESMADEVAQWLQHVASHQIQKVAS